MKAKVKKKDVGRPSKPRQPVPAPLYSVQVQRRFDAEFDAAMKASDETTLAALAPYRFPLWLALSKPEMLRTTAACREAMSKFLTMAPALLSRLLAVLVRGVDRNEKFKEWYRANSGTLHDLTHEAVRRRYEGEHPGEGKPTYEGTRKMRDAVEREAGFGAKGKP